jgi:hypothetical protein
VQVHSLWQMRSADPPNNGTIAVIAKLESVCFFVCEKYQGILKRQRKEAQTFHSARAGAYSI